MKIASLRKFEYKKFYLDGYYLEKVRIGYKVILSLFMASLTGLAAQVSIPLPFTPVPITGQTLAVLLSGVILGKWGGLAQLFYVGLGIMGIPWFSGWGYGAGHLVGPTGGYIVGFILASFFIGKANRVIRSGNFLSFLLVMLVANFLFIHSLGLLHLYLWFNLMQASPVGLLQLFKVGTLPFIPGDILKIIIAAALAKTIMYPMVTKSPVQKSFD